MHEETGITDCYMIPMWDYEQIWDDGVGRNNGRAYFAIVHSLGSLPESEMEKVMLFDDVPENYTYDREEDRANLVRIEELLKDRPRGYKRVVVCPYDSGWVQDFQAIRDELEGALKELAIGIEHVGSTSVPGLSAKPIIDIDIIIEDRSKLPEVIAALASIGYVHEGNGEIEGREVFGYDGKEHLRKHHLYVCAKDAAELRRHLMFRDYLRSHPEEVKEYSRVKEEGAKKYPFDIDGYIAYKSPYIEGVYKTILSEAK